MADGIGVWVYAIASSGTTGGASQLDTLTGELVEHFGIDREDLNLDLGPLGTLLPER